MCVFAAILAFKGQSISYLEVINCGLLFYLLAEYWKDTKGEMQRKQNWFLLILTFLPTVFLVLVTFKNGHTFGLTQRYSGFSFPYSIILVSLALIQAGVKSKPVNYAIWAVFVIHLFTLTQTIEQVLADESLKYNYRDKARGENPYPKVAESLTKMYQTGDTIVYPSYSKEVYKSDVYTANIKKSVLDAQYVNLYLPKDAEYIQTVDARERDKVFLKKKDGKKIEIFDFKGDTFRY